MAASLGMCHFLAMIQIKTVALSSVLQTAAELDGAEEQTSLDCKVTPLIISFLIYLGLF